MNPSEFFYFFSFLAFIVLMLLLDLGVVKREHRAVGFREALLWTALWVSLAFSFYLFLYMAGHRIHGIESMDELNVLASKYKQPFKTTGIFEQDIINYNHLLSLEFITGYLIEEALSMDNIFVIILIFAAFGVEKRYYHSVLFWGILGAIVFRCLFIFAGAVAVTKYEWILYVFAAFLVYTGIKMFFNRNKKEEIDPQHHPVVRFASKYFAVHPRFEGNKFVVKINGKRLITPLFLTLLIIEFTDVIFAVDSIPAIFSVTKDPYIIFFSNIFAILGLRSMFFLLINVIGKFRYFKHGLSVLLVFIGVKMLFGERLSAMGFTIVHSLLLILLILAASVVFSLLLPGEKKGA